MKFPVKNGPLLRNNDPGQFTTKKESHHVFWVAACHRNFTVDDPLDPQGRVIVGLGKSFCR